MTDHRSKRAQRSVVARATEVRRTSRRRREPVTICRTWTASIRVESIRDHCATRHSYRTIKRNDADRRNASPRPSEPVAWNVQPATAIAR